MNKNINWFLRRWTKDIDESEGTSSNWTSPMRSFLENENEKKKDFQIAERAMLTQS